jgi:hypothetical protein
LLFLDPGSEIRDPGSGMGKTPRYTSRIRNTGYSPVLILHAT